MIKEHDITIGMLGMWHLGSVYAACCGKHFNVIGMDLNDSTISNLKLGKAPIYEPLLDKTIQEGVESGRLSFTTDISTCQGVDILWITYDTPINSNDECDVDSVLNSFYRCVEFLKHGTLVLVSSQVPVGTCCTLQKKFPQFVFAYSPENLRLGNAISVFEKMDRVVIGINDASYKSILQQLFAPFTENIIFMSVVSAEMVKHSLNSFLALCVTYINEVALLCEHVGANVNDVSLGLKSDVRIGNKAYLKAGGPFAGGTLARDVVILTELSKKFGESSCVISSIKKSNDLHKNWVYKKLKNKLGDLKHKKIAVLGLTYTANTNTLRRSVSLELCELLLTENAKVHVYDPNIKESGALKDITVNSNVLNTVTDADAVVVFSDSQELKQFSWTKHMKKLHRPLIIDLNSVIDSNIKNVYNVEYISLGT